MCSREIYRLAALIACHNRKEKTLACLEAVYKNNLPIDCSLQVILVDDGSTDGTADAVRVQYPAVEIILGDGKLYWNKSMHRAFARAMDVGFDAYLWLNDDTMLYPNAIDMLLRVACTIKNHSRAEAIIVGTTQDPDNARPTYGGLVRSSSFKRFSYTLTVPTDHPIECHTMNGNCVFVPNSVAQRVGNLEPNFAHAMGDTDYGLRATNAGVKIFVAPAYVGTCAHNSVVGSFNDLSLPAPKRWEKIMSIKGLPPRSWWIFTRRHGGLLALIYWAWPYVRLWLK
jgi:GT2 family glycosyltransferase